MRLKRFNEVKLIHSMGRFFFDSDGEGHWYMIPLELKEQWSKMTMNDFDDDDYEGVEEFERIFGEYRTGGGISDISFENPEKIR